MKYIIFCLMLLPLQAVAQQSFNMTLLANVDDDNLPVRFGAAYSDCWGYYNSDGIEIAIIAGIEDIFFYNVTAPANPVLIYTHHVLNMNGTVNQSLWRDFATYQHYIYASSDEGDAGLLIFDLEQVPTSITLVAQTNEFWSRTHTIFIDELYGRLYAAGSNTQSNGLKILNLAASPTDPPQIGAIPLNTLGGGYVHDVYVRNNIAYCSHGSLSRLMMYNMNTLSNITVVGIIDNYPEEGYNHSSWLNEEGNMLVMADETQGSDLKLVDISDPLNISSDDIHTFYSELEGAGAPGASLAHNPYINGDLAYISYYHDGVQVFDVSDPENIVLIAYYDTYPENTGYSGYQGCWGVYPFFPSGTIVGSDMTHGLYLMQISDQILGIEFLSFEAYRMSSGVKLHWTVANPSFGNRFEIKRSSDAGLTFEKIGTVQLIENQNQYSFLDQKSVNNQNYMYRIDFVELDGRRINSPIRNIQKSASESTIKVVNPISSSLIVDLLKPLEKIDLNIYDLKGLLVFSHHEEDPNSHMEFNVEGLTAGQYVLVMNWPGGTENLFVQVIH